MCGAAPLPAGQVGGAERDQPAAGEQLQPFPPVIAAQRVQNHVNPLAAGQPADLGRVVDGAVIDGCARPSARSIWCSRPTPCRRPPALQRCGTAAARPARPAAAISTSTRSPGRTTRPEQHVVSSEVIDRERSGLLEAHLVRDLEHLPGRHAHHIRVSPKCVRATTRWPTAWSGTPSPSASTTPAASYPTTHGAFGASGYSPCAAITSAKFSPAARTRMRTCPGPASGSAVSRTCSASGPPALVIQIAP